MTPQFTVCCLLYGDYPTLAERLLESLCRPGWFPWFKLRIGWNNLSRSSADVLLKYVDKLAVPLEVCTSGEAPFYKYPTMRKLFAAKEISTPYVMWFDDDSYIMPTAGDDWFANVAQKMGKHDMIGAPYFKSPEGAQLPFWAAQSWYTGKPWKTTGMRRKVDFITGGWWTIWGGILRQFDWPSPSLEHNGGDVMLGALLHQQGKRLGKFTEHLGINCDTSAKCSSAKRRGFSQKPAGYDYKGEPLPSAPTPKPDPWRDMLG